MDCILFLAQIRLDLTSGPCKFVVRLLASEPALAVIQLAEVGLDSKDII